MRKFILNQKTIKLLFLFILATFILVACSDKEDDPVIPPALSNVNDRVILFPPSDHEYDESLIEVLSDVQFTATSNPENNVRAVPLSHFILNYDSENYAKMYTYQIVAHDGVTSRRNGSIDPSWYSFSSGHLLIDTGRTYFHDFSHEDAFFNYNIAMAREIRLYRSIVVVKPDGEEVLFQVNILKHENRHNPQNNNNSENAFKMTDLISNYITKTPQNYEYFLTAADYTGGNTGSSTLQWSDIQDAWYSRTTDRVFYPQRPADVPGNMRLRDVVRIELRIKN